MRMLRWASTGATVLSALLCLATCAIWVRGRYIGEDPMIVHVGGGPPWTSLLVQGWSSGGGMRVVVMTESTNASLPAKSEVPYPPNYTPFGTLGWHFSYCTYYGWVYPGDDLATRRLEWGGFQWVSDGSSSSSSRSLTLPDWFAALIFAIMPALAVIRIMRRRRSAIRGRHGFCPQCGYDLRATPAKCPECGAVPGHTIR